MFKLSEQKIHRGERRRATKAPMSSDNRHYGQDSRQVRRGVLQDCRGVLQDRRGVLQDRRGVLQVQRRVRQGVCQVGRQQGNHRINKVVPS